MSEPNQNETGSAAQVESLVRGGSVAEKSGESLSVEERLDRLEAFEDSIRAIYKRKDERWKLIDEARERVEARLRDGETHADIMVGMNSTDSSPFAVGQ